MLFQTSSGICCQPSDSSLILAFIESVVYRALDTDAERTESPILDFIF